MVLAPPRRSARVAFALEQESCVAFTVNIVFVICYLKILSKTCASRRIERFTQSVPSFPAKRTTTPPLSFFLSRLASLVGERLTRRPGPGNMNETNETVVRDQTRRPDSSSRRRRTIRPRSFVRSISSCTLTMMDNHHQPLWFTRRSGKRGSSEPRESSASSFRFRFVRSFVRSIDRRRRRSYLARVRQSMRRLVPRIAPRDQPRNLNRDPDQSRSRSLSTVIITMPSPP